MAPSLPRLDARRADFGDLRDAYLLLADIIATGGMVERQSRGLAFRAIPRSSAPLFQARLKGREEAMAALVGGMGEKKALDGREEVVLSVMGRSFQDRHALEICALKVRARGPIIGALVVSTQAPDWADRLRGFVDWTQVAGVLCAADGNNQRAGIGMVLAVAGIGKGTLPLIEMEVPQEIDESTHLVRGAEWMKAGLPRFHSAASEALWYLIRARALHSRMFREKKQGYYTAMAVLAGVASGVPLEVLAAGMGMGAGLVAKLSDPGQDRPLSSEERAFVEGTIFGAMPGVLEDARRRAAAGRIWKGPAIYLRGMDWRQSVSRRARAALGRGEDLVEVAEALRIQRRELVRILSQALGDGDAERDRFSAAVAKPEAFAALFDGLPTI